MNISDLIGGKKQPVTVVWLFALAVVVGLAFFMRLAMVDMIEGTIPIRNDAKEYYFYTVNLKESGVYSSMRPKALSDSEGALVPDARRPPGYALFLYPFVEAPPTLEMVRTIRVAQVVLSTLTVLIAFLIFREFVSNAWALMGTLLVAVSPHLVSMNIYLLTESLFTFVLALFVYLVVRALGKPGLAAGLASGAALGMALLVKSSILYFLPFLVLLLIFTCKPRMNYRVVVAFCVGVSIVFGPWVVRNWSSELPDPGKSKALVSLQNGSYPGLMYNDDPATRSIPHRADPDYDDVKSYGDFLDDILEKISKEPGRYVSWYLFGKAQMMLSWDMVAGAGDVFVYAVNYSPYDDRQPFMLTHDAMKMIHPALMVMGLMGGIVGLVRARRERETGGLETMGIVVCGAVVLYYFLLHILVTPLPRYMIPLRPYFYGLAIYLLASGTYWVYTRRAARAKA